MTGLLPDPVVAAIGEDFVYAASESFGVVALVLLVALLVEYEVQRIRGAEPRRMARRSAVIAPLFVVVMLVLAARIAVVVT